VRAPRRGQRAIAESPAGTPTRKDDHANFESERSRDDVQHRGNWRIPQRVQRGTASRVAIATGSGEPDGAGRHESTDRFSYDAET
jgi:hypothetical protein